MLGPGVQTPLALGPAEETNFCPSQAPAVSVTAVGELGLGGVRVAPFIKTTLLGFPGGAAVESPPADAGDAGSCPGPGRSHMPRSGWAREPRPLSLRVQNLCSATGEATTVRGPRTESQFCPEIKFLKMYIPRGFPGGAVVENLPANSGDTGSSPGVGGSHMPWSN